MTKKNCSIGYRITVMFMALAMMTVTCKNTAGGSGGTVTGGGVSVISSATDIQGSAPAVTLPSNMAGEDWKGVFVENRSVKLSPFSMAKTETDYKLWKEVYDWAINDARGANKYTFENSGDKGNNEFLQGAETEPVTLVNWRDVIVWCNAYTEKTYGNTDNCVYLKSAGGKVLRNAKAATDVDNAFFDQNKKGFRLPTEAEWEYAARVQKDGTLSPLNRLSGATKPCGFKHYILKAGETWDSLKAEANKVAVFNEYWNGSDWVVQSPTPKTATVGSKYANALGLYDMSGNVEEWCWDWYGAVSTDKVSDPTGAATGSGRIVRGGHYNAYAEKCLPGYRSPCQPYQRSTSLGFRLAWRS